MSIKQPYTTYLVALLRSLLLNSYIRAYVPQSVSVSAIFQSIKMQIRRLFAEPVVGAWGEGEWALVVGCCGNAVCCSIRYNKSVWGIVVMIYQCF